MKIELQVKKIKQVKADCEVVFVINKKIKHKWVSDEKILKEQNFKGAPEESSYLPHKKKLYISVASLAHDDIRVACSQVINILKNKKCKSIKVGLYEDNAKAITEGFLLGVYNFDKYKSKKQKNSVNKIIISSEEYGDQEIGTEKIKQDIGEGQIISEATNYVRDIVNESPDVMTPIKMSELARELANENKLEIKIYDEKFLKKEGMGAFLAVAKSSPFPPQLIHFIHKPKDARTKIVLVGKGLTYDSGGLSIKPASYMSTMKMDEAGAAAVFGVMQVISKLNLNVEVHGIAGVTENVIDGQAYKPDDILTASNGKTIEVKNTDAEGRLVLADCLVYGQKLKPDYIIDIATLTGACVVALGEYTVGVMGNNKELKQELIQAADNSGELAADLPFNKHLPKALKSEIADIPNSSSSRYGGAITAAIFLGEFVEKKYKDKWVHLDIAGPAYSEKPWGCNPFGATGASVRMLVEWIKSRD